MLNIKKIIALIIVTLLVVIFSFPTIFTMLNSFMSEREINNSYDIESEKIEFITMKLIPEEVTIEQYYSLFIKNNMYFNMFWNSILIVLPITLGQVVVSLMASYAFHISKLKWKEHLFFVYIVVMLMPIHVTLVPNYIIADKLNLIGSYLSIIFPGIFNTYGVFLLRQYMKKIPKSYIEAARIDGASTLGIFIKIVAPLCKTAIVALAILTFIDNWNMVEQPIVFLKEEYKQPLSTYLYAINQNEKGVAFAASFFYMIPMLLMFLYCGKYLTEGIKDSGNKG
ncbi:binding-protein-dependent transport system inner membrane component [Gottschalkia acidurici 9a]|uniref:Binding-protein-dependent transport system inner membrane component n=1 Tax=Gottschalkia acidurici (strain ATCC 7906 / DSM 604 / BCRC 14475 / CIP 104303 / KCTC 5404 / NCIMB 10678 / 9a) TaxID=1128398 RepID=K0B2W7_GOTA9|nr:carbohydrate ABC transporter permease [Gottschalkia acidurici]AFS78956.1 binding-protein-dependent transport system inner membrane component [Gottschalkia acidurici 9a]